MGGWRDYFAGQVRYQGWANEVLFGVLDRLTETERRADLGLFFHDMHRTVDHLLVVNRLWRARLRGEAPRVDFKTVSQPEWEGLKTAFREEIAETGAWVAAQPDGGFEDVARFTSSDGKMREMPVVDVLTHMMYHLVHHRGQVSAAVTRLGGDAPEMDYLYYLRARASG